MELPDQDNKRANKRKILPIVLEIGVILGLVVVILLVLTYADVVKFPFLSKESNKELSTPAGQSIGTKANKINNNFPSRTQIMMQTLRRNKAIHYSVSITEYQAIVKSINLTGGTMPGTTRKFQLSLFLGFPNSSDQVKIYLPKTDMGKIQVFQQLAIKQVPLTLNDLKIGDRVVIRTNSNLLPPQFNLNKLTIIKQS